MALTKVTYSMINGSSINVLDYGAVGNGSTDCSVAITNALTACPEYGTVVFPSGTYVINSTITVPKNNITIDGQGARFLAKASTNFEYVLVAVSKTNIKVKNLVVDVNQINRISGQNIRFMGMGFTGCTDSSFENCTVSNALGYNSIPAVGLTLGGSCTRCQLINCVILDCGTATQAADGIFTSGEANLIIGCTAANCTDTAFVIESSNSSGIVGCIARNCSCGAAITNASANDKYANFIAGLSVVDWNAVNTGGIQIGCPLSTSVGYLYDTVVSDVTMSITTAGRGTGPAIAVTKTGTPKAIRLTLNNIRIRTASKQGILVNGDEVSIRGCDISGTTDGCIQFQTGSVGNFVSGCVMTNGSFGIIVLGNAEVTAESNLLRLQTLYGIYAFNTSQVDSMFNVVKNPGTDYFGKDGGATLNLVGVLGNVLAVNNATGTVTTGSIVNKFVVSDKNGTPLGYVPVYNI